MVLALPEPVRRKSGHDNRGNLRGAVKHFVSHWRPYASLTFGYSMLSIVMNTYQLWGVQYFVRNLGFDTGRAGLWVGFVIATFGTLGVLAGGWLHDRFRAAGHTDAALRVGVIAAVAMLPSAAGSTLMTDPLFAIALMIPIGFFTSFGFGASGAAIVLMTPPSMRGTASALYLFFLNIIAMGMGPLLTASLNDAVFHSDQAVGKSVAIVATTALLVAAVLFAWGIPHVREMHQRAVTAPGGLSTT